MWLVRLTVTQAAHRSPGTLVGLYSKAIRAQSMPVLIRIQRCSRSLDRPRSWHPPNA